LLRRPIFCPIAAAAQCEAPSAGGYFIGLPVASLISHLPTSAMSASFQNHSDSCVGSRQPGGWWRWRWRCNLGLAGWAGRLRRCGFETSLRLFPQRLSQTPPTASQQQQNRLSPRSGILSIMGDASNVIDRVAARVVCNRYPWQGTTAFAHPCPQSAAGAHLHKFATSVWRS
jgi:hypothetical protein